MEGKTDHIKYSKQAITFSCTVCLAANTKYY